MYFKTFKWVLADFVCKDTIFLRLFYTNLCSIKYIKFELVIYFEGHCTGWHQNRIFQNFLEILGKAFKRIGITCSTCRSVLSWVLNFFWYFTEFHEWKVFKNSISDNWNQTYDKYVWKLTYFGYLWHFCFIFQHNAELTNLYTHLYSTLKTFLER